MNRAEAQGSVFNLSTLEDFNGSYTPAVGSGTVGGSRGVRSMKNQNSVVSELKSMTEGITLKLPAEGIKLTVGES